MSESVKHNVVAFAVAFGANKHDAESLLNKRLKLWEDIGLVLKPHTEASLTQMLDSLLQLMTVEVPTPAEGPELIKVPNQINPGPPTSIPTPTPVLPPSKTPTGPSAPVGPTLPITTRIVPVFLGPSGPMGPVETNPNRFF